MRRRVRGPSGRLAAVPLRTTESLLAAEPLLRTAAPRKTRDAPPVIGGRPSAARTGAVRRRARSRGERRAAVVVALRPSTIVVVALWISTGKAGPVGNFGRRAIPRVAVRLLRVRAVTVILTLRVRRVA